MANYIVEGCLDGLEYIVSASTTLSPLEVIDFNFGEEPAICGTVISETELEPLPLYTYLHSYTDCCECLSGLTESLNFSFIQCGTENEINIEAFNFCDQFGLPTTGLTYEIQFGSETPFCATFEGLSESGETNYSYVSGPFSLCEDCENLPPLSSNTETTICQEICDNSVITIIPPHPTYTNSAGREVVQMNAVLIGGNGLNG
jgi:hypothetical protein